MSIGLQWTEHELDVVRSIDLEIARLVSEYSGGRWHQDTIFVPSADNLDRIGRLISAKKEEAYALADSFWRDHFVGVLESLEFSMECNRRMPYEFVTRMSAGFDSLTREDNLRSRPERAAVLASRLAHAADALSAIKAILSQCGNLGRSQVSDLLPPLLESISKAVSFIDKNSGNAALRSEAQKDGSQATTVAREIESMVKSMPLASLEAADIPFRFSVEKGMQVPLDHLLSWCDSDVEMRREEFFRIAKEIDPKRDPYSLLNNGSKRYSTAAEVYSDIREILDDLREEARRFVDIPEGESCGVGDIPPTWRIVCPTFMYMGGLVAINPENIPAFTRAMIEETLSHECYPGHHVASVKASRARLPNTFRLGLFMARAHQEGIAHRSEYLMMPFFKDPISRLEAAKRGWYCATRVKVEVDLYHHRKPVQEVIDNYINNLNCTEYSAVAQTRAHMMRPADGISYYAGMRFLENLYQTLDLGMKEFTDETFNYGNITLQTMKSILELPPAKKEILKAFNPLGS